MNVSSICKRNMYISVVQNKLLSDYSRQKNTYDPDLLLSFFTCKIEITFPLPQQREKEGNN